MSVSGIAIAKAAIITSWLADPSQPAIIVILVLGLGFDYPYIRWVIHAGVPVRPTAFAQESGRAGRDGRQAFSIILLSAAWQAQPELQLCSDQEAIQFYLSQ